MSLWNRGFNAPLERWMNHVVRRELDHLRRPQLTPSRSKGLKDAPRSLMAATDQPAWLEPYWNNELFEDPFREFFAAETNFPPMNALASWSPTQVISTINDKGDLVLKTKLPLGITQDDVHLDFEEGGLKLTASKYQEEEKQLTGPRKGTSKHTSNISISHFWPLGTNVKAEDIEAHWNEQEGLLEISVMQPHLEAASKSTPITIGGQTRPQMLDEPTSLSKKVGETVESAKTEAIDTLNQAKETASKVKEAIFASKQPKQDMQNRSPSIEDVPPSIDEL